MELTKNIIILTKKQMALFNFSLEGLKNVTKTSGQLVVSREIFHETFRVQTNIHYAPDINPFKAEW
jgi:hypothetical protein